MSGITRFHGGTNVQEVIDVLSPTIPAGSGARRRRSRRPCFFATGSGAAEKSLYERLGGVFAIAAVVDHFSDAVVKNPIVGQKSKNPQLREWHTKNLGRLPGLKFMRTLWVCNVSGGPYQFTATKPGKTPLGLEEAHRDLRISPAEFDEVAAELGRSLDFAKVPKRRRPKSWQPSPPTKTRSPPATSRPLSAAEALLFL